ncbi:tumor necrosis factor receptor superfamily member 5 [Ascaphus truei]|uniref:tumor necrosis factor receptor superfamily member 5 n=1 Tax=Ascaphus truei TaxID=8439 RepID=UPI003F5992FF
MSGSLRQMTLRRRIAEDAGLEQQSGGTAERDVVCRCQSDRHCSSQSCETCVLNTLCLPGHGVTQRASLFSDTQCSPCAEGTFSNITSSTEPCGVWRSCDSAQQDSVPGSRVSDVTCTARSGGLPVIVILLLSLLILCPLVAVLVWVLYRRVPMKCLKTKKKQQGILLQDHPPQIPEEDQDPALDTTMQGLPVAQEQGKDSHMSQEEV